MPGRPVSPVAVHPTVRGTSDPDCGMSRFQLTVNYGR